MSPDQASARLKHSVWKCSWTLLKNKPDRRTAKCVFKNSLCAFKLRPEYNLFHLLCSQQYPPSYHITFALWALGQSNWSSVETKLHKVFTCLLQPPISAHACKWLTGGVRGAAGRREQAVKLCQSAVRLKMWLWTVAIMWANTIFISKLVRIKPVPE